MGNVKIAKKAIEAHKTGGNTPPPAPDALKDRLKDDLTQQPKLRPAAQPKAHSKTAKGVVEAAKDEVIKDKGGKVETYEAFVDATADVAGPESVAAAQAELLAQVKAEDTAVAKNLADTVDGNGSAAWIARPYSRLDEDEEEEEDAKKKAKAKKAKPAKKKAKANNTSAQTE